MTPTFCWLFLLALMGRAASMPQPLVVDACALLCNPGAETEEQQERGETLYPRGSKVNCKLQSDSEEHQAWVLVSHCLKLCNRQLSVQLEATCFTLRSSLGANLGCNCEALTPLSPNTIRLHESWKLNLLVKELANDILTTILESFLDLLIICDIHNELLWNSVLHPTGEKFKNCFNSTIFTPGRRTSPPRMSDYIQKRKPKPKETEPPIFTELTDPFLESLYEEGISNEFTRMVEQARKKERLEEERKKKKEEEEKRRKNMEERKRKKEKKKSKKTEL